MQPSDRAMTTISQTLSPVLVNRWHTMCFHIRLFRRGNAADYTDFPLLLFLLIHSCLHYDCLHERA